MSSFFLASQSSINLIEIDSLLCYTVNIKEKGPSMKRMNRLPAADVDYRNDC